MPRVSLTFSPRDIAGAPLGCGVLHAVRRRSRGPVDVPGPGHANDRIDPACIKRAGSGPFGRILLDGGLALAAGDEEAALEILGRAEGHPGAAWTIGLLRLRRGEFDAARAHLEAVLMLRDRPNGLFDGCGVTAEAALQLTPEIDARIPACEHGARLALAEVAQAEGRIHDALHQLDLLARTAPDDIVVLLWIAELARDAGCEQRHAARMIRLTERIANETLVHAALLLHRGRALAIWEPPGRALAAFSAALRRRRDRPSALLRQVRYERAVLHESLGWRARARRAFEDLYAEDPGLEDVAKRLAARP